MDIDKTILISIVSYREHELENTVKEFYNKALNNKRLKFAIVSQSDVHPDLSFIPESQISYFKIHHTETKGVTWARSVASKLFSDFDFYLQIDAHMFPEINWDQKITETYYKAVSRFGKKVLLTAIPAAYTLDASSNTRQVIEPGCHAYGDVRGATFGNWPTNNVLKKNLMEINYIQGACLFSTKELINEMPIDPDIYYFAEEITYSIRCFDKRYKIIAFDSPIFYHLFAVERIAAGVHRSPFTDQLDYKIFDKARAKDFFRGKLDKPFGVSKQSVIQYCSSTGYIYPNFDKE
jgi:hypothetical protein